MSDINPETLEWMLFWLEKFGENYYGDATKDVVYILGKSLAELTDWSKVKPLKENFKNIWI